uniref:PXA domain-containing protein n=1 Tax=Knipowitschia caucasica TaxID=637954 RepID=A0AAV2MH17_KNICA
MPAPSASVSARAQAAAEPMPPGLGAPPLGASPLGAPPLGAPLRLLPALALGLCVAVVLQLLWGGLTSFFLKVFVYVSFALLCFLAGSFVLLTRQSPLMVRHFSRHTCPRDHAFFSQLMGRFLVPIPESSRRVVVSHNMDKSLKEVFDLAYRDYILSWYVALSEDEGQLYSMLSEDWWQMIGRLRERLSHIDLVNVLCYDCIRILHTHFTDLKTASARPEEGARPFPLHPKRPAVIHPPLLPHGGPDQQSAEAAGGGAQ